jgi:hypothetical protein
LYQGQNIGHCQDNYVGIFGPFVQIIGVFLKNLYYVRSFLWLSSLSQNRPFFGEIILKIIPNNGIVSEWKVDENVCSYQCSAAMTGSPFLRAGLAERQASRVARWYILKPQIPLWVNFGGPWNGKCWYILWPFGIFHGRLVHFMAIR